MAEKYWCPECRVSVTVGVALSQPPTHKCARHVNKTRPMEHIPKESTGTSNGAQKS